MTENENTPPEGVPVDEVGKLVARIFDMHPAAPEAREAFANAVLNGERHRLAEQPSKSSSHRLAQQQALGRLAEIVFHYREFLEIWGKPCSVANLHIGVVLETEAGTRHHAIELKPLVASLVPAGEDIANKVEDLVFKALRNCCWSLACLSKEVADVHAYLEQELLKPQSEEGNGEEPGSPGNAIGTP